VLLDLPFVEASVDLLRDPALLPAIGACVLAVVMLPWWTVPICAVVISLAGEIVEWQERAAYGFQFGDELLMRAGACLVVFGLLHLAAAGLGGRAERRAARLGPVQDAAVRR
jgi:hypothetical protein